MAGTLASPSPPWSRADPASTARLLEELQELALIGFWEWRPATGELRWSPQMHRIYETPAADPPTYEQVAKRIHPDDEPRVRDGIRAAVAAKARFDLEHRIVLPGGRVRHVRERGHVRDDAGGVLVLGTTQDVTGEREAARDRDQWLLASIIGSSNDAIVTKTLDGIVTSWNPAAESIFGYTAAEMVGRPIEVLFPPDRLQEEPRILARIRAGEKVDHFETQRRRKDGRIIDVSVTISPVRDYSGRIVGASKVARDITDLKRSHEDHQAAQEQQIRRLQELQEFRARFVNVAAHELKTPLTPIRIQVEILSSLLSQGLTPEQRRSLEVLRRSVDRLNRLVEDFLDAARVQATQLRLRRERFDLSQVAGEAVENYRAVAAQVGVALEARLEKGLLTLGDPNRMLQVASNLVSNAVKFTPRGGRIAVETLRRDGALELRVSDTGRGLSEDQLGKLFLPFSQVHHDLEATARGTGLGLYILKGIVEQHGGTVAVESPGPGRGSVFTVRMPVGEGPADPPAAVVAAPLKPIDQRLRDLI